MINRFPLSSDDCELLLAFENTPVLSELCTQMCRDHSVVARSLKRISETYPVVEKKAGKWCLTEVGKKLNEITRSTIVAQVASLNSISTLRIGTNREFSARVLGPDIQTIQGLFPETILEIHSFEKGTEDALIKGQIDIGIDCDRPFDPEISYKQVIDEPIVAVASIRFIKLYKKDLALGHYYKLPHLFCARLNPDKILSKPENTFNSVARFNDIATARAACLQGLGWGLLPRYAIKEELEAKKLIQIDDTNYNISKYGIWWPRNRLYLKARCDLLIEWLKTQQL